MNPELPLVDIFILSYNRPEYLFETLESVLNQTYSNIRVTISDNSTLDEVERQVSVHSRKNSFNYIRRRPSLPALDHFNKVFEESSAEYLIVFHDDDVMLPEAVSKLVEEISQSDNTAAVGTNAFVLDGKTRTKKLFDPYLTQLSNQFTPERLAIHYLQSMRGHVPFPSYLYRRVKIEGLKMNYNEGQKHSDVSFLIKVSRRGSVRWLREPLMYYRCHGSNDSVKIDVPALFSLCRFLKKNINISPDQIDRFKMKSYILWVNQRRQGIASSLTPWRDRIILKSAVTYALLNPNIFVSYFSKRISLRLNALMKISQNPE